MQILGPIGIQGKQKEILLKEEDMFFKYYSLELIGIYTSQIKESKIIFKKDNNLSQKAKIQLKYLVERIVTTQMLEQKDLLQIIGKIEIEGKIQEILLKNEEGMIKYYSLNLIGVYSPKIPGETIIFKQDTLENSIGNDIKDNEQRKNLTSFEKEQIKQLLQRIRILDVFERIQKQERGNEEKTSYHQNRSKPEKGRKEQQRQKQIHTGKTQSEDLQEPNKQQMQEIENKKNDVNIKQEVKMNTRVTDMSNLQQVLEKNNKMPSLEHGDEPLKMGIIESDEMKNLKNEKGQKEQGHTSRYEAVVITKKGKVKSLDLENDTQEGTNPREKNYQVKQNKSVKGGDVLTRLKLGEGTIGIEKAQYGEVEVYHSPRKTIGGNDIEGNKSLDRQLETSNAKNTLEGTEIENLKLAQEYNDGYRSVEQGYQEVEKHQKKYEDCQPKGAKDLDGDINTQQHSHELEEYVELSSGEKITYQELASRWGFYKDGKPDATFIKEKFKEKEQGDKKPEEVIGELDEEYQDPRESRRNR